MIVTAMFTCPNCTRALQRRQSAAGVYWGCQHCGGRTVAIPVLRKVVSEKALKELWRQTSSQAGLKRCPTCGHRMNHAISDGIQLDVCRVCQFVWFDAQEFEQMPPAPVIQSEPQLPQAAREAIALYEVKKLAESVTETGPPSEWQHVPAIFGMPVECDSHNIKREPLLTWSLAGLIAIISVLALYFQPWLMEELAFIPGEMWRHGGLTLITPFFLHGGAFHLLSNLYYFLVFGNNVEDYLGHWRYALLLLTAIVAANFFHAAGDPHATIPCVGASGGISAVIAFYALKFPHARLGLYLTYHFRLQWVHFPAWAGLAIWILLQVYGAIKQISGFTNVSALAHLGGAATGIAAWLFWGWKARLTKVESASPTPL